MENIVEALKIAFAVMMFVLGLSISISSFSSASTAIASIIEMRDRETEYTYVEPSTDLTRTVGIETVVSTMYRAFAENIEIKFEDKNGNPIELFYATDTNGNLKKDAYGISITISSINLANEGLATQAEAKEFLDIILGGKEVLNNQYPHLISKYEKKFINDTDKLYEKFKDKKFKELVGEYYQGEGASQIKKRVITYRETI